MARYAATQQISGYPYHAPRIITQDEYDRVWKPAGWNILIIGPTSTWRHDWTEWEAIRDIVQNCLDEDEKYYYGYDEDGLWIADRGKGVAVADFLLGPPRLKPDYARGKFGEGMKIAALALVRQGHSVHVETVGRQIWIVFIEQKVNGKVETLGALWKAGGTRTGTKFHIIGYRGPAFERYFAVNLPRSAILAEVPSPITQPKQRYNQLIRAEGMAAGVIYCRDIYFTDIHSPFSYNLWGFEMAPDRHGPKDESKMWTDAGRLWSGIKSVPLLSQFLSMVTEPPIRATIETHHVLMFNMGSEPVSNKQYSDLMVSNASHWNEAWRRAVGSHTVIRTSNRWDSMVKHLGYESQSIQWGVQEALSAVIKTDESLIGEMLERLDATESVPDNDLTEHARRHLELARAIARRFSDVRGVKAAVIPPASDQVLRTDGLYEPATALIKIHLKQLESARDTIDVMVHEIGHHVAFMRNPDDLKKAEDLTPGHSQAMTYVSARIFKDATERLYDDYLKDVAW